MKHLLILLFHLPVLAFAQNQTKEVLTLLNAARSNPQDFISTYVRPYLKANNLENNAYAKSLIADLSKTKSMDPFNLSQALTKTATDHAKDMGFSGATGHNSTDGTSFDTRLRKNAKAAGLIGENCDYGDEAALDIVMHLLIDDGVESVGHRKNILEPNFKFIGIGIEKHKTYNTNCVMDFAQHF